MEFTEVSSILKQISDDLGLNDTYYVIMSKWKQEVGNDKIELNGFKDGKIFASTKSAVYLNDFNLRKRQIINKLNQYLGRKVVKNIKCEIK
ncbi:MAG: DUF721 domain-containing protein [Elusimicrobia bacterium]|jgi:hypothetical protein|nr:DUF721 domain-containing protein [Elusimicrobiota bacterium]MBR4632443.1 DUF721 domain-containing protein [Elusimicrobiota bacterium]